MESPLISQANSTRIDCLLVLNREANISNCYIEAQDYWSIDSSWSEVIEFSGCHFDGKTLKRGRMWFETGRFDTAGVWREKSDEFLKWADAIYRTTKKILLRDPDLDAYVGGSVPSWRAGGGQLVEFATKGVPSIIAGSRKMQ